MRCWTSCKSTVFLSEQLRLSWLKIYRVLSWKKWCLGVTSSNEFFRREPALARRLRAARPKLRLSRYGSISSFSGDYGTLGASCQEWRFTAISWLHPRDVVSFSHMPAWIWRRWQLEPPSPSPAAGKWKVMLNCLRQLEPVVVHHDLPFLTACKSTITDFLLYEPQ